MTDITKKDLEQIKYLKSEILNLESKIHTLRERCEKTTSSITDMPKGVKSLDNKEILVDTMLLLEQHKKTYTKRLLEIEKYIFEIDVFYIKNIIRYRYIECKSWTQVARLIGGNNTADGVRKSLDRFFEQKKKSP